MHSSADLCYKWSVCSAFLSQYISFFEALNQMPVYSSGGEIPVVVQGLVQNSQLYRFVPGDILAVVGADDDNGEQWWLLQVSRAFPLSKNGARCHVYESWLDKSNEENGLPMYTLPAGSQEQCIMYCNIWHDSDGDCVVIPQDNLQSGWVNHCVKYTLTSALLEKLDSASYHSDSNESESSDRQS